MDYIGRLIGDALNLRVARASLFDLIPGQLADPDSRAVRVLARTVGVRPKREHGPLIGRVLTRHPGIKSGGSGERSGGRMRDRSFLQKHRLHRRLWLRPVAGPDRMADYAAIAID